MTQLLAPHSRQVHTLGLYLGGLSRGTQEGGRSQLALVGHLSARQALTAGCMAARVKPTAAPRRDPLPSVCPRKTRGRGGVIPSPPPSRRGRAGVGAQPGRPQALLCVSSWKWSPGRLLLLSIYLYDLFNMCETLL